MSDICEWYSDEEIDSSCEIHYETKCNESFYFVDGSLADNPAFIWCPFCGKEIKEEKP
jgi:hypothetical protein